MNVTSHRHVCRLFRSLEKRAGDHIETEIAERRCDHLGATVVAVLAKLGDQCRQLHHAAGHDQTTSRSQLDT